MTRTQLIVEELLAVLNDEGNLDQVRSRHGDSRSPLFGAIAKVLLIGKQRLRETVEKVRAAARQLEEDRGKAELEQERLRTLQREASELEKNIGAMSDEADATKRLLAEAARLQDLGFTMEHLKQIYTVLGRAADSHNAGMKETLDTFFELTEFLADVASAKVEAKRLQAQLRETKKDMRGQRKELAGLKESLEVGHRTLKLLAALDRDGLGRERLASWQDLLHRSGVSVEELGNKLKQYGTLLEVLNASSQSVETLRSEKRNIERQIADREREQKMALCDYERLLGENFRLAYRKETLESETKDLRFYVELTRLLMEADDNGWAEAPPDYIMWMLIRAKEWLAMASPNNEIRIPPVIARKRLLLSAARLTPTELLEWLVPGVHQALREERPGG